MEDLEQGQPITGYTIEVLEPAQKWRQLALAWEWPRRRHSRRTGRRLGLGDYAWCDGTAVELQSIAHAEASDRGTFCCVSDGCVAR